LIYETIITTVNANDEVHVAPFGVRKENGLVILSPFKPSITLDNCLQTKVAIMNLTDDVRTFASAVIKQHQDYLLIKAEKINGLRLADALAHQELRLTNVIDDAQRPELHFEVIHQVNHRSFLGFNRAQAAVVELAVLVTRLSMLPKEKVLSEKTYLQIAIDKTAGPKEMEAWSWLNAKIEAFYAN
jgi:uncharacterized protein